MNSNNDILTNVCGYELDSEQKEFVKSNVDAILLIASAGSGKTLSLIGKIRHLIENKNIKENEILCISYTNEAVNSLKQKLLKYYNYNIEVKTFHKLSSDFLKHKTYKISPNNYLDYIVNEYFKSTIYLNKKMVYTALKYLNISKYNESYLKNNNDDINKLKKLLVRFIHLFKSNNYDIYKFSEIFTKNQFAFFHKRKNKLFIKLAFDIYQIYMSELMSTGSYDFNDLINTAICHIPSLTYKYIIIDEYQDTSLVRLNLIKKIIEKTKAKLIVVGDDYQSIYRFSGSDLNIFLNFTQYFKKSKIMYINNTYRNSKELIFIANNFIMKNKYQITKHVNSSKNNSKPIKIIYYDKYNNELLNIINKLKKLGDILIIGRNNNDIYKYTNISIDNSGYLNINSDYKIRYLTVHKSKGLEADNTILINLEDKILGFPNKLENDNVLKYVLSKERYCYDEERRLFYVALTRTKNNVYLIINKNSISIFVKELISKYNKFIETM